MEVVCKLVRPGLVTEPLSPTLGTNTFLTTALTLRNSHTEKEKLFQFLRDRPDINNHLKQELNDRLTFRLFFTH
jgi:hypothetical protein